MIQGITSTVFCVQEAVSRYSNVIKSLSYHFLEPFMTFQDRIPKKTTCLDNFCFSLIKIAQMTRVLFAWAAFGLPWLLPCRSLITPCSGWNDDTYDTQDNIQRFGQACFNKSCVLLRLRQVLCLLDQWDELLKDFWPQRIQWQPCSSHRWSFEASWWFFFRSILPVCSRFLRHAARYSYT